jgi:hypothetical protein
MEPQPEIERAITLMTQIREAGGPAGARGIFGSGRGADRLDTRA